MLKQLAIHLEKIEPDSFLDGNTYATKCEDLNVKGNTLKYFKENIRNCLYVIGVRIY